MYEVEIERTYICDDCYEKQIREAEREKEKREAERQAIAKAKREEEKRQAIAKAKREEEKREEERHSIARAEKSWETLNDQHSDIQKFGISEADSLLDQVKNFGKKNCTNFSGKNS